jgi:hypothetical protein
VATLKLGPLPDRTPVRLTVALPPELHRLLTDYAAIYLETYGQEESVTDMIPFMLQTFLEGDRDFVRARRARSTKRGLPSAINGADAPNAQACSSTESSAR